MQGQGKQSVLKKIIITTLVFIILIVSLAFYESFDPNADVLIPSSPSLAYKKTITKRCGRTPEVKFHELEKFHLNLEYMKYSRCTSLPGTELWI